MKTRKNFFQHLHPVMINRRILRPSSTLGLGIVCIACFIILGLTGLALLLNYSPIQDMAYEQVLHIITSLRFGRLVRNIHFLTANVLLIAAGLHMARVFFTGSYQGRRLNWTYGLFLLGLISFSNYTGYLLPWDQTSYWAIKVGSNLAAYFPWIGSFIKSFLLAGEEVGPETLTRSFVLHVAILPFLLLSLASVHFWRIRKDGGLAAPQGEVLEKIPSAPLLFRAELGVGLFTLSFLLLLAAFIDAPLYGRADPLHPPNPAKAPWYFVGIQEMVSYSAFWGGVVAPFLIVLFLFLVPFLDRSRGGGGQWFQKERLHLNIFFVLILSSQIGMIVIGKWFRTKNWVFQLPWQ